MTEENQDVKDAMEIYYAIRGATLEQGWEWYFQSIVTAIEQAQAANKVLDDKRIEALELTKVHINVDCPCCGYISGVSDGGHHERDCQLYQAIANALETDNG